MTPVPKPLWAYAYQFSPPLAADQLHEVRLLLKAEHRATRDTDATWVGRFIADERIAHLLVVSDSPDVNREVNRRIEMALRSLDASFSVTASLAVAAGTGAFGIGMPIRPIAQKD